MRIPFQIPPRESRPFDVVGMGQNSVDLVAVVAEYPPIDSKQRLQRFARLPGGQVATAMAVCSRLGWRASYVGTFGDDELGRLCRESLVAEGVDIAASWTVAGATNRFAIVIVDARSGSRTVLWDRHPALTIEPSAVRATAVTAGRMLLVDCSDTAAAAEAARHARATGIRTVIDVERVRPGIADLLANIDAIIAAAGFPTEFTGHAEPGRALHALAREFDAPLAIVTLGRQGSLARANGREIRSPGFDVDCVDTTGAGDAFRAGFIAFCLRSPNGDLEDALAYANAVAALNCRALGARGAMPTPEEVDRLLGW